MLSSLDLVAFGAHPDDVELFCGGIVARAVAEGRRVAIVDLTAGEAASRGTPDVRAHEAAAAAAILGVAQRRCLGLPDGGLRGEDPAQLRAVVAALRALRPATVLAPWRAERHPDHEAASRLVTSAAFFCGVGGFAPELGPTHPAPTVLWYPMRVHARLSLLVDVSDVHATKVAAIEAHASQVGGGGGPATLIGASDSVEAIVARDRYLGVLAGCRFAEGLVSRRPPVVTDVCGLFEGVGPAHFFEEDA
jgi:bacillithiol biosynthesis deacetylase BshB1